MPFELRSDGPQPVQIQGEPYETYVPGHLARASVELVHRIHRQFFTVLESQLTEALQTSVGVIPGDTRQVTFAAMLKNAEAGGCTITLELAPLRGYALLHFPPAILFRILDILLATPPDASASSRNSVTEIELHILREFFDIFISSLHAAWEPVYPVDFKLLSVGIEGNAEADSAGDEIALTASAGVSIGDVRASFELAVPSFLARLAEIHSRGRERRASSPAPLQENLLAALSRATVQLEAVLQGSSIRMGDLVAMQKGQVLLLGMPAGSPFDCLVNGKQQFKGEMVATGNHQGFQID